MACKHLNGTWRELNRAYNEKSVRNGVLDEIGINEIDFLVAHEYSCDDCGKTFNYTNRASVPKWWQRIYDQLEGNTPC